MGSKLTYAAFAVAALAAGGAAAQTTLTGIRGVNDRIDEIETDARVDLRRSEDQDRFGNPEMKQGLTGSLSLGYSGTNGQTDRQDFTLGARLRSANGPFVQTIGMVLEFSEIDGTSTQKDVFGVYDANYYLNDRLYLFGLGRVSTDGLATTATETKTDAFIGFGPGYRIVNTPELAWRVQAGIGYSYLEDGTGTNTEEPGAIASSRLYWNLTDAMFLTNDTDILKSDSALRVNNEFGVNFRMSETFVTRVSYLTDYNDTRAERSENKLGVSLVFAF